MARFPRTRHVALVAIALTSAALLTACNRDADSVTASTTAGVTAGAQGTGSTNTMQALAISGAPANSVVAGSAYRFTPVVSPAATGLTFSIANKPAWASFDVTSGTLSGTPAASNVGSYTGIVISANRGGSNSALASFSITVTQVGANTGSASLSWTPPSQNTDGTTVNNLAGYNIYYGTDSAALVNRIEVTNPGLTAYTVADLGSGTYYFGVTAYTASGVESDISRIGSKTIM